MILFEEASVLVLEGEVVAECTQHSTIPCSVVVETMVIIRKHPLDLDMIL